MKTCKCGSEFVIRGPGKQCRACRREAGIANADVITQEVLNHAHQVAVSVSRKSGKFHLIDELNAAALEGVALAATTWDPTNGVPFLNFACIRAKGACQDLLRHWYGRPNRYSGPKMEAAGIDLEDMGAYEDACGREDSAEIQWLGLSMAFQCESFLERVKEILNHKQWMALSTFLTGEPLQSVANQLGLTESRASQLRKEALDRLDQHRDELTRLDPRAA